MNHYDTMRQAMREAEHTMAAADSVADVMANMLRGRLRKVSAHTLVRLKKELDGFDAHRKVWKEDR